MPRENIRRTEVRSEMDQYLASSLEFDDYLVDSNALASADRRRLDRRRLLGAEDVFHLHRLHHSDRLAGLDFVADVDVELRQ